MKQKVSPAVVIAIVVVLVGGMGFVVWHALTGKSDYAPVVVKPQASDASQLKTDTRVGQGGL